MESTVRKVFAVLGKVPCYIAIGYLLANIVFFAIFYFRALGMSYVVMQTAVENNYIPADEAVAIRTSLSTLDSVSDGGQNSGTMNVTVSSRYAMFIDTSNSIPVDELYNENVGINEYGITTTSVNRRVQYGRTIKVGIGYCYTAVTPVPNRSAIDYNVKWATTPIKITYTVPGLKYYPDL